MKGLIGKFTRSKPEPPAPKPVITETPVKEMENTDLVRRCVIFKENPLRIAECQAHLVRLLNAISANYQFTERDIEDIYFSVSFAWNSKDLILHRLILLFLRSLKVPKSIAFMMTHSLAKDAISDIIFIKAVAIRYMPHLLPPENIKDAGRFIQQLISSSEPLATSSALLSAFSYINIGGMKEVRNWLADIKASFRKGGYSQYHAQLLLYKIYQGDGISLKQKAEEWKNACSRNSLQAHVLIQCALEASNLLKSVEPLNIIKDLLSHRSPITCLDAVRAILSSELASPDLISATINRLHGLLQSPTKLTIFAALRTISQYAAKRREEFAICNSTLERLLNEPDKQISSLAAISLLHTGFEATIDRVLPKIGEFTAKLSTDQLSNLLQSCVSLTVRCPVKAESIISFMWTNFRQQDNQNTQRSFIDALFNFWEQLQNRRNLVLKYLCEYIEDAKYNEIAVDVINFLAKHATAKEYRMEVIRVLCNRLLLDLVDIRAAAIDAIAVFAVGDFKDADEVKKQIERYCQDPDDEVRDRALFYTSCFKNNRLDLITPPEIKPQEMTHIQLIKEQSQSTAAALEAIQQIQQSQQAQEEEDEQDPTDLALQERFGKPLFTVPAKVVFGADTELPASYTLIEYEKNFVLKFTIKNTMSCEITDLSVELEKFDDDAPAVVEQSEIETLGAEQHATCYVALEKVIGKFEYESRLVFKLDDEDKDLPFDEPISISPMIYMQPTEITNYEEVKQTLEAHDILKFKLNRIANHDEYVSYMEEQLCMKHLASKKETKIISDMFAGKYRDGRLVIVSTQVLLDNRGNAIIRLTVNGDEDLYQAVIGQFQ